MNEIFKNAKIDQFVYSTEYGVGKVKRVMLDNNTFKIGVQFIDINEYDIKPYESYTLDGRSWPTLKQSLFWRRDEVPRGDDSEEDYEEAFDKHYKQLMRLDK